MFPSQDAVFCLSLSPKDFCLLVPTLYLTYQKINWQHQYWFRFRIKSSSAYLQCTSSNVWNSQADYVDRHERKSSTASYYAVCLTWPRYAWCVSFCSASGVPNSSTESNAADTFKIICQICLYPRPFSDILVILCAFLRMVAAFVQSELFVLKLKKRRSHSKDTPLTSPSVTLCGHLSHHITHYRVTCPSISSLCLVGVCR